MTNEDYQLEELENAAVNKSNNAKRAAAAAGFLVTGGAAGFAATKIPEMTEDEEIESLSEEDLEGIATTGANQVQQAQPEPKPQAEPQANVQPEQPQTEDEPDITFDKTVHVYDEDQNLIMTKEVGTVDGHEFQLIDVDNDLRADIFAYDQDGNGIINEDEITLLPEDKQIAMGNPTGEHEVMFAQREPEPEPVAPIEQDEPEPYIVEDEKDIADNTIHNDFEDEKTGEKYEDDYAENNRDYYNNGDVENYSAGEPETESEPEYAYEEDAKEGDEYEYDGLAENETDDDITGIDSDPIEIV